MASWYNGYINRKKITIDSTKIDADLTDFPVLVKLDSTNFDFSRSNPDGYDIRFTSDDGKTLLSYERERHDSVNQVAEYWVKIPSISSTADTVFYMYYRKADTPDGADPVNVWNSHYRLVTHLSDNPDNAHIADSTSYANNGTKYAANEPIQVDEAVVHAQSFDGSDDEINLGTDIASLTLTQTFTYEAWVLINSLPSDKYGIYVRQAPVSWGGSALMDINSDGTARIYVTQENDVADSVSTQASIGTGAWVHLTVEFNANDILKIYKNGVLDNSKSTDLTQAQDKDGEKLLIGAEALDSGDARYIDGKIDEVRVSDYLLSDAWIKANYYTQTNNLLTISSPEWISILRPNKFW